MSYERIENVPVMTNEIAVILDTGDIVAISINRSVYGSRMVFSGMARCVNEDGSERYNRSGIPIRSELKHTDPRAPLADEILKDCLLALLGEPIQIMEWGNQWLLDVSIRQAISVSMIGHVDPSKII